MLTVVWQHWSGIKPKPGAKERSRADESTLAATLLVCLSPKRKVVLPKIHDRDRNQSESSVWGRDSVSDTHNQPPPLSAASFRPAQTLLFPPIFSFSLIPLTTLFCLPGLTCLSVYTKMHFHALKRRLNLTEAAPCSAVTFLQVTTRC